MSDFVNKASSKISKLSDEQILRLIQNQQQKLNVMDSVLSHVPEGFLLVSYDGKILYHNKYLSTIIHLNNKHNSVDKLFNEPEAVEFIKTTIKEKKAGGELFFNVSNSIYGEMEIRLTGIELKEQKCFLFSFKDFTFFRRLYDEFRRSESLAAMTTMAAEVAHEIKNPLASMSIYLQLLQRKLDKNGSLTKEDAEKSFKIISDEIERLNKIAVDFLFAVKPLKVNPLIQNVNDVIRKTVDIAQSEAEEHKIELVADYASSLPSVRFDSALIQQCLVNLLKNSIQSLETRKEGGFIRVNSYLDGNNVKIDVSDNGCGMSEEVKSKIFEPYYTTKAAGTGLGLTNIFKIMKEHDGDISVSSKEGEGSVFTLSFPVPKSQRFRIQGGK